MRTAFSVLTVIVVLAGVQTTTAQGLCTLTVESACRSPQAHLGDSVCWSGTVRDIVSSSIPVKILMKTGKSSWIVTIYTPDSLDDRAMNINTKAFVNGTLYGAEKVIVENVETSVPAISATRISTTQSTRPAKAKRASQRRIIPADAPKGYKDKE